MTNTIRRNDHADRIIAAKAEETARNRLIRDCRDTSDIEPLIVTRSFYEMLRTRLGPHATRNIVSE